MAADPRRPPAPGLLQHLSPVLNLEAPSGGARRWAVSLGRLATRALSRLPIGADRRGGWGELDRALAAFQLVKRAEALLDRSVRDATRDATHPADLLGPLSRRLDQLSRLEPTLSLWATEGLGHALATRVLASDLAPTETLAPIRRSIPLIQQVALEAGWAMACASHALRHGDSNAVVDGFFDRLEGVIPANRRAMAAEVFGMVTRLQFRERVDPLERALAETDQRFVAPFWHGVGRALYFSFPRCFDRAGRWRALDLVHREPPHDEGRRNALSGFAWPWLLVNLNHPARVSGPLARWMERVADREALASGAACALLVRRTWSGRLDPSLTAFLAHQPPPRAREAWQRLIVEPTHPLLERGPSSLLRHHRFAMLFQYQDLASLPKRLATPRQGTEIEEGRAYDGVAVTG